MSSSSPTLHTLTYLAGTPSGEIIVKQSRRALGALEVKVKTHFSGVCATDSHDVTSGCGLGHEGVGVIVEVGWAVGDGLRVGVRVGWGWQHHSCGHCRECIEGYRACCPSSRGQKYGELEQGAFGDYVIKHQDFVYPVPEEIESEFAGPLQCAGITVYEALDIAGVKPTDRIGIVGFGGLGHLAVQYAKAMGCEPVVFSRDASKEQDAMKMGAGEFHVVSDTTDELRLGKGVNVLLLCGGKLPDFELFMPVLARRATIVPLIIQGEPLNIPYMPFLLSGHKIIGSTEATRKNHTDALSLAARHNIRPWIEVFPMTRRGLTEALEKLRGRRIRYRAVLSAEMRGGDDDGF